MQAKNAQLTIAELANEIGVNVESVIAGLNLKPDCDGSTPVTASSADKLRRAMSSVKQSTEKPTQLRLVSSGNEEDEDADKHRGGGRTESLSNEEVKAIATQAKVPQYMIRTLSEAIFNNAAIESYTKGRNNAQLKYALTSLEEKGAKDFEDEYELQQMIARLKESEQRLNEAKDRTDTLSNFELESTLKKAGLRPDNPLVAIQKQFDELMAAKQKEEDAIAKVHNGEPLTEEEKKMPSVMRLIRMYQES